MKKFMHVGVPTDKVMEGSVYAEGIKNPYRSAGNQ